jgi:hypothetical protein
VTERTGPEMQIRRRRRVTALTSTLFFVAEGTNTNVAVQLALA